MILKHLYIVLLFISCSSIPKETVKSINKEKVTKLISNLSWDSMEVVTNYGTLLRIKDENALALEKLGKEVSVDLLEAIKNEDKSVIAHLILTNIWEPEVNFLKVTFTNQKETDDVIVEYRVNNFSWYESPNTDFRYSIDTVERDKIYKYWSRRITEVLDGHRPN